MGERGVGVEGERTVGGGGGRTDSGDREGKKHLRLVAVVFWPGIHGATRGVTVSMSAFLACHQCYCAGSSLTWGLNLRAVVCGIF